MCWLSGHISRIALTLLTTLALAACSGPAEPVWAPQEAVTASRYVHGGPPTLTLYTVISTRNGSGAHSGLMINGDERILFDPAGTFSLPFVPERNDVHFGITERARKVYIDYHARETYDVRVQTVAVSIEQARLVSRLAKEYGAVPKAQCSLSITRILSQVPGFGNVGSTYFPKNLSKQFGERPGGVTELITDDDADKNHNVLFEATLFGG